MLFRISFSAIFNDNEMWELFSEIVNTINLNHDYEIPTLATLEPCHATRMCVHRDTKDRESFVKSSDFFSLFPLFSLFFLFKNAIPSIGAKCLCISEEEKIDIGGNDDWKGAIIAHAKRAARQLI